MSALLRLSYNLTRPFLSRSFAYESIPLTTSMTLPIVESTPTPPPVSEVRVSRLKNGVTVVTNSASPPISRISISVPAGSRYQMEENVGVAHFLRHNAFLTNSERTGFRVTRELELIGATLHSEMTRDLLVLTSSFTSGSGECVLENLAAVYGCPEFRRWEVSNERILLDLDRMHVHLDTVVDETIHKLSYRTGLGMPMFTPECRAALITNEQLMDYYNSRVTAENTVIVASGIEHREFVRLVDEILVPSGRPVSSPQPPRYYGGSESHIRLYGDDTVALIATEGVGVNSEDLPKYLLLRHLLGGENEVKRGDQSSTRFGKCISSEFNGCNIHAVNINHMDSGLFGLMATAPGGKIRRLVEKGLGIFRDVARTGITPYELKAAKNRVKTAIFNKYDEMDSFHQSLTLQVAMTGAFSTARELSDRVERVSSEELQSLARKVNTSKPNLVVAGNLSDAPYLDGLI